MSDTPPPITFVLSGGVTNQDPNQSLGGPASPTVITDITNNLFADVTGAQVSSGFIDYRCFYIFNDGADDYTNFQIWIDSQVQGGSATSMGIVLANEIQTITFNNTSGGTFSLSHEGQKTADITFDFDGSSMASNIQTALQTLSTARDVQVTPVADSTFAVEWNNYEQNKWYPLLELGDNNLLPNDPSKPANVTVTETQAGSPINSVTVDTGAVTTPPTGVTFSQPDVNSPIVVGTLKPTDGFAVWLQRNTDAETPPMANDGLVLMVTGDRVIGGVNA